MLRKASTIALLLVLLVGAGSIVAQDAPPPVQPDGTPSFGTITLNGNFILDPFIVTLVGGGVAQAADLNADCAGFVPPNPSLSLVLSGDSTTDLRIFTYSDEDPVLVVKLPSGEYVCNDDSSSLLVDSTVLIPSAEAGEYDIWVGAFAQGQLVPTFLVMTHSADVTAALFDVGSLVERMPPGEMSANFSSSLSASLRSIAGAANSADLDPAAAPQVFENAAGGGQILAFETDERGIQCAGYVDGQPTLNLTVPAGAPLLNAFFEATSDATLVIVGPNGELFCNDDVAPGNLNPGVLIPDPAPGVYAVYVGTFDPATTAVGRLVVGSAAGTEQAVLEAAPPANQ